MELKLHIVWNFRVVWVGMILILLLGSANPTYAIEYHFEDDFSNGTNWSMFSWDWGEGDDDAVETTPLTNITDGELVFNGTYDNNVLDIVYVEDHTRFGSWSFDVFQPSGLDPHRVINRRLWAAMFSEYPMGLNENQSAFSEFGVNVKEGVVEFTGFDGTSTLESRKIENLPNQSLGDYQHYDIVRTSNRIYVIVDGEIVMNHRLINDSYLDINYFTLTAVQGSQIKFDNIQITTDYQGKLDELNIVETIEEPITPSDTLTIGELLFAGVGTVAIGSGVAVGYRYLKKKRWKRLISLSTNGSHPQVVQTISQIFSNNTELYLFLLSNKKVAGELGIENEKLTATLTSEMQQYRHLLHPLKLSIMQMLYSVSKLASIEIREALELSWSDFYNTMNSLEKIGMIEISENFDDKGLKRQYLAMPERAKQDYMKLIQLIDAFIEQAKELIPGYNKDFLYPKS